MGPAVRLPVLRGQLLGLGGGLLLAQGDGVDEHLELGERPGAVRGAVQGGPGGLLGGRVGAERGGGEAAVRADQHVQAVLAESVVHQGEELGAVAAVGQRQHVGGDAGAAGEFGDLRGERAREFARLGGGEVHRVLAQFVGQPVGPGPLLGRRGRARRRGLRAGRRGRACGRGRRVGGGDGAGAEQQQGGERRGARPGRVRPRPPRYRCLCPHRRPPGGSGRSLYLRLVTTTADALPVSGPAGWLDRGGGVATGAAGRRDEDDEWRRAGGRQDRRASPGGQS